MHSWLHRQTQSSSFTLLFLRTGVFKSQSHTSAITYLQPNTNIPNTYLSISQVTHSLTHTNMHSHKHSHTVVHADSHRHTHTAPNTSRAYFISNCEKMLLVFINLQTLCLPISLASLSLFPTLSLSARRQVSASIFSSSVAVKLNGIGLIAENQREG